MANVLIRDLLNTVLLPASNTFLIADGATQGTVKFALAGIPFVTSTRTTLAGLSVTGISTGVTVQTLGGSAIADGSATLYYYNSASSATPNGTTIIQPTVGTGRWLAVSSSNLPAPTALTLGGVFSKAGVAHQFLSALDTAGNFTLSAVDAADVTGLGSMSLQNANAVVITGGSAVLSSALLANTGFKIRDTDASHSLAIVPGSNLTADRILTLITGDVARNITLNGNPTLNDWFDQSVKSVAIPVFAAVTASATSNTPAFRVQNATTTVDGLIGSVFDSTLFGVGTFSAHNVGVYRGNTQVGLFTAAGFNGAIGGTTPAAGIFTTINVNSAANRRTTKGNFNLTINVKDYGAVGNGVADDTTPIDDAFAAAIAIKGTVYFPAGTYKRSGWINYSGITGLSIIGEGKGVSIIKTSSPSVVLNLAGNHVNVSGLTFDGSCTSRTAGQQAVIFNCSQSSFCKNEIINSGEYAFFAGSGATVTDLLVTENFIGENFADGINLQNVDRFVIANNVVDGADDDGIALGQNGSGSTRNGVVIGNFVRARNNLGTTWGRGIFVGYAVSLVNIVGNYVTSIKQDGIFLEGVAGQRVTKVQVKDNYVYGVAINSGHGIKAYGTQDCTLEGNTVENQVQGNSIEIADWNNLAIKGGMLRQGNNVFARGIHVDEGTWATTEWIGLEISGVSVYMLGGATNTCVYLAPHSSITMNTGTVGTVVSAQAAAGDYIYIPSARASGTWKLGNNITLTAGRTVNPAASTGAITVFNNN